MTYKIEVRQEHLNAGMPTDCSSCPVALAMKSAELHDPYVGMEFLEWGEIPRRTCETPAIVRKFIMQFDDEFGPMPRPFSFELTDEREGAR